MKKILLALMFVGLCAGSVMAGDLKNSIQDFLLSNGVEGSYFVNGTSSQYLLSTGNSKGDKVYGSGSFVSAIYEKDIVGTTYASTDLTVNLTTSSFVSSTFSTGWAAK